jgi:hypothetical protein
MNDPKKYLLTKLLTTDEVVQLRDRSLDSMLAGARVRRRRRQLAPLCLGFLLVGFLLGVRMLTHDHDTKTTIPSVASVPSELAPARPEEAAPQVKFITTEELLALFPDRPLALVGPPGRQRLIFFDEPLDDL